jgi:chromosome condensin MukBEF ATPase and DNA-binding subunit MukB
VDILSKYALTPTQGKIQVLFEELKAEYETRDKLWAAVTKSIDDIGVFLFLGLENRAHVLATRSELGHRTHQGRSGESRTQNSQTGQARQVSGNHSGKYGNCVKDSSTTSEGGVIFVHHVF